MEKSGKLAAASKVAQKVCFGPHFFKFPFYVLLFFEVLILVQASKLE